MKTPVYLDNHATTPVDPRVLEAMLPTLQDVFGNASSRSHSFGWEAEKLVDAARAEVATLLGADPREILFTSGATESNNLAILGVAEAHKKKGRHIISARTEHPAVIDSLAHLETKGYRITWLPLDRTGRADAADVGAAISDDTILITLMAANNEIGTIHPFAEIGAIAKERGVLFHCDATQAVGKIAFDVQTAGVDLVSITAHKMYGPKGSGALYLRRRDPDVKIAARSFGGGQERGIRPGTLNVPGIVGLGACARCAREDAAEEEPRIAALRDRLQELLFEKIDGITLNGHPELRVPGNLNVSIAGTDSDSLMMSLPEIAISSGSACASGSVEPSKVLTIIGTPHAQAKSSIRFGVGRFNTAEEIEFAAERVIAAAKSLRRRR